MFQYHCLNPIAEKGLGLFDEEYKKSEDLQAVSYTHLDVYKRQVHEWVFRRQDRRWSGLQLPGK